MDIDRGGGGAENWLIDHVAWSDWLTRKHISELHWLERVRCWAAGCAGLSVLSSASIADRGALHTADTATLGKVKLSKSEGNCCAKRPKAIETAWPRMQSLAQPEGPTKGRRPAAEAAGCLPCQTLVLQLAQSPRF